MGILEIILLTAIVGILGMGLGGLVAALLGNVSSETMCWMLSFAGGVMVSIVCFELIPEGVELGGMAVTVLGLVFGIIVVMVFHHLLDRITMKKGGTLDDHIAQEGIHHENKFIGNPRLLKSGVIMLVAISLHNLPEGIAIGAAGTHDLGLGVMLAIIIMLHCIPEGMAIAAPLIGGGIPKVKAVFLTTLSGVPTILGGAIGVLIGGISDTALALALTGAGGAMLYVVFGEILPQSSIITKSRFTTIAALGGIIVGLLITALHY